MIYFTSDTHFIHNNIIKYCNRPFSDSDEMDEEIIKRWNEKVGEKDTVYHLGDFALGNHKYCREIMDLLNGKIHLIKGNHEKTALRKEYTRDRFETIKDIHEIKVEDEEVYQGFQMIILCHYPMMSWHGAHRGTWQLFGHVHGKLNGKGLLSPNQLDVGVDCHDFAPISYDEVKTIITQQNLNK